MTAHHLAEFNIARTVAPLTDPRLADFVLTQDSVNAAAEVSPGFVWRLKPGEEDGGYLLSEADDRMLLNLTVWTSCEALFEFTYRLHAHAAAFRRRRDWFEPPTGPSHVLWWLPQGKFPTLDDANERLELLAHRGPTPDAFTFKHRFPAPR